jgi:uncharacterized protein involved in exopolysaccharide biosynthesis
MASNQLSIHEVALPGGIDNAAGGLDLRRIMDLAGKHMLLILSGLCIGIVVGGLICIFMAPRYDAVADLNIHPRGSGALNIEDPVETAQEGSAEGWDEKVETQVLIVSSTPLAWDVVSQLRLDQNASFMEPSLLGVFSVCRMEVTAPGKPIDSVSQCQRYNILRRFAKSLDVEVLPKTQAIRVRFRSKDSKLAADVVNSLTAAYVRSNFQTRYNATMQASGWLHDQLGAMKWDMEDAGMQLAEYQKAHQIVGTDEDDNLAMKQLSEMGAHATDAEADRILEEAKYRLALTGNPELIGTIVPDTVLPTLRNEEVHLSEQLAQADAQYGANYPGVIQLQSQLDEVRQALVAETRNIQSRFQSEFEAAEHTEADVKKSMDRLKQNALAQSAGLTQYELLKNEADSKRDVYKDLLKKLNEATIAAGVNFTNIDVIEPADVPVKPVLPNVPVFLLVGAGAGLIVALAGTLIRENLDRSIRSIAEVREIANLPILGMLPHLPPADLRLHGESKVRGHSQLRDNLIQLADSEYAESIRTLRTSLMLNGGENHPQTVMVTSPLSCDGKSLVSINLASSLAAAAQKVLLVDADLRQTGARRKKATGEQKQSRGANWCSASPPIAAQC